MSSEKVNIDNTTHWSQKTRTVFFDTLPASMMAGNTNSSSLSIDATERTLKPVDPAYQGPAWPSLPAAMVIKTPCLTRLLATTCHATSLHLGVY